MNKKVHIGGYVYGISKGSFGVATDYHNEMRCIIYPENDNIIERLEMGLIVRCSIENVRVLSRDKPNVICGYLDSIAMSDYCAKRLMGSKYFLMPDAYAFHSQAEQLAAFVNNEARFDIPAIERYRPTLYREFLEMSLRDFQDIQISMLSCVHNRFKYRVDRYRLHAAIQHEINMRNGGLGEWRNV